MGRKRTTVDAIRADLTVDAQWIAIDAMMDEGASEERIERARMEANLFALLLAANALDKPERKQNADHQFPTMERREIKVAGVTFRLSRGSKAKVWGIIPGCRNDLAGTTDAVIGCGFLITNKARSAEVCAWKQASEAVKRLEEQRNYLRLPENQRAKLYSDWLERNPNAYREGRTEEFTACHVRETSKDAANWLPHYETIRAVLSAGRIEL